jgi:hypothetical protein
LKSLDFKNQFSVLPAVVEVRELDEFAVALPANDRRRRIGSDEFGGAVKNGGTVADDHLVFGLAHEPEVRKFRIWKEIYLFYFKLEKDENMIRFNLEKYYIFIILQIGKI